MVSIDERKLPLLALISASKVDKMRSFSCLVLLLSCLLAATCSAASPVVRGPNRQLQQAFSARQRVDGAGIAGAQMAELLANINRLAAGVPRLGSNASSSTSAEGDVQRAERRTTSAVLRTLPLSTSGRADGGAAQVSGPSGFSAFTANSTSVAKDVVSDKGSLKSFGASSIAQGFTNTTGGSTAPASTTRGSATTAAGEKALPSPNDIILDGSTGQARISQQGIGGRVSARLQAAALSALSGSSDRPGKAQSGGGYLFAAADSRDGATSATRDFGKASNTAATLSTNSGVNRFGYSNANDAADVRVESTDSGSAQVAGGRFGTGFNFGAISTTTSTYAPSQTGKNRD